VLTFLKWLDCGPYGAAFATSDRAQLAYTNWMGQSFVFNVHIEDLYFLDIDMGESYSISLGC
jgi:hypothetical protein